MAAIASTDPAASFTFKKEPETIMEEFNENDVELDRLGDLFAQSFGPWIDKYDNGHRKRDLMKELRQSGVLKGLWKSTSILRHRTLEYMDNLPPVKQAESRKSKGSTYWESKFDEWKAIKRELIHMLQHQYDEVGGRATRNDWFGGIDSDDGRLGRLFSKAIPENERYNNWRIIQDDTFARKYLESVQVDPRLHTPVVRYCAVCEKVVVAYYEDGPVDLTLTELIDSAEKCEICSLILRSSIDTVAEDGNIHLFRAHAALRAGSGGERLLRFSANPDSIGQTRHHIPIGRPVLPDRDSTVRFELLRAWIRECDDNHRCNRRDSGITFPTRVLDLGDLEDMASAPERVRLTYAAERKDDAYVALSHCWGNLTDSQKTFCTSQSNLNERRKGFSILDLPQTFQDAIQLVRWLGLRYLWIDCLCIVQFGDDGEDWHREAIQMKNVFSQASFVIAATAAADSYSGFLNRGIDRTVEHVCVQADPDKRYYISSDIDDYDNDVGKAVLNTRAWVMQESVLARRTIHFTTNQMYWECGKGIHCENLTRLKSTPRGKYFEIDPEFPKRLVDMNFTKSMWNCISFLFEDYSRRDITFVMDRPVAISGLEDRVAEAIFCKTRFGTFERFLHRGLLWYTLSEKVTRIKYNDPIPSWSWLSCSGGVQFMEDGLDGIELNQNLAFRAERKGGLVADLGAFVDCIIRLDGGHYALQDASGSEKGWLKADVKEAENFDNLHCVVVGKNLDGQYLVIAVVPNGDGEEYRRFGMGLVNRDCVVKVQDSVYIA